MKLLVTGALQATEKELNILRTLGMDITEHPNERDPVNCPEQYDAVICNGLFLYQDITAFSSLKYIQLTSAGYDRAPMEYIAQHGIEIHNAAGVYSIPMAEWTIMRILELYRNAAQLYENQRSYLWRKDRDWCELYGKTVCIVGFGAYGKEVAQRLKAFGVTVHVVNRSPHDSPYIDRYFQLGGLNPALAAADIVSLAVALTPKTHHMFGAAQFAAMKHGALFVNAARGGLVDTGALVQALRQGKLAGAALDVFEQEPLDVNSPLWKLENVLLTPHNSFVGEKNHKRLMGVIIKNCKRIL